MCLIFASKCKMFDFVSRSQQVQHKDAEKKNFRQAQGVVDCVRVEVITGGECHVFASGAVKTRPLAC